MPPTADPDSCADRDSQPLRLLDQVRERIRVKHDSIRTEQAYADWIRRFILFHGKRHPLHMGAPDVEAFLTHLSSTMTSPPRRRTWREARYFFCIRRFSLSSCRGSTASCAPGRR